MTTNITTQKDSTMITTALTPYIVIETITPDQAETYLLSNTENRPIRESAVDRYAADMAAGNWRFTGEPIQFAGARLMNGQHRLRACIKSGAPFTTVVIRNVDADSFEVMDSGMKRALGDVLTSSLKLSHGNNNAAAARIVMAMQAGMTPNNTARSSFGRPEIIAHVRDHHDLYAFASRLTQTTRILRRASLTAFIVLLISEGASREVVERFFDRVQSGENLARGDARLALRNWAAKNRKAPHTHEEVAVLIYAWNAWAKGADSRLVKRPAQGAAMPTIERVHPIADVLAEL